MTARRNTEARLAASPFARAQARALGLDLSRLAGSGPGGRIVARDLERAPPSPPEAVAMAESKPEPAPAAVAPGRLCLFVDVALDAALARRANAPLAGHITINDLALKALALALDETPAARPGGQAGESVDIAVTIDRPGGEDVAVLRDVAARPLALVAADAHDLTLRARTRKLGDAQREGGCLVVSNVGMFGVRSIVPATDATRAVAVGLGAAEPRVVAAGEGVAVATVMTVCLVAEAGRMTASTAARLLAAFKTHLEKADRLFD